MKVLVDTNVILDALAQRMPFYQDAARIWALAEVKQVEAFASAISFTTVYYIARRLFNQSHVDPAVQKIARIFSIAPVDRAVIDAAIAIGSSDFEDAVQAFSGAAAGATHVVTRDASGFDKTPLAAVSPAEFLRSLKP